MAVFSLFLLFTLVSQLTPCSCGVDTVWMNTTLSQHFSQPRHHVANPGYKQQTMTFIRDEFRALGLETHIHTFPTLLGNVTGVNVIGVLKGRHFNTPSDRIVGIGAHYDTMRNTPGVNDNGAAVVVMLQAARELSPHPVRNYTLFFVAFDFEEWESSSNIRVACGHISCGSKSLVKQWMENFWSVPLGWRGMFIMDTIMNFDNSRSSQHFPRVFEQVFRSQAQSINSDGGRGDFLMVAGRKQDKMLQQAFHAAWTNSGQPQFELESFTVPAMTAHFEAFLRSDHVAFWEVQMSAVFISDTADYRSYMSACYHQACDRMDKVTPSMLDFAAKTCRTLISVLDKMAPVVDATSASDGQRSSGILSVCLAILALVLCHFQTR
ncbi:uncharacterized protein [Littorina saxatilis]|uniref:Peptidase M28 domain-containing protein n=1 Tax=Littorina saxatilis TaxID=31220 RepID=A0AAN9GL89_9CAEN